MSLMTVPEWARHVGADKSRVYKWIKNGRVKTAKDVPGYLLIDSETPKPVSRKHPTGEIDEPTKVWSRIEADDVDELHRRYGSAAEGVRVAVSLLLRGPGVGK